MRRPLLEVVASQREMIRRRGTVGPALGQAALIAALQAHLNQVNAWLAARPLMRVCDVDYHKLLAGPKDEAARVCQFLERPLDIEAMTQQVVPSLWRQRTANGPQMIGTNHTTPP
jgi:hypothetical protein